MSRVRTNKNICLYCFGDLDGQRVCLSCHKKADDTPSMPHHIPQRTVLNQKYLIAKALGEGGFGITYLGWDLTQGIKVAVKEYFPSGYVSRVARSNQVIINAKLNQAASNRGLKRFIDEAKTLAKIKNLSGIVNVRDFFSDNGTAYIVMEFLDGVSLKKYLQRKGGKVSCDEILTIMRPIMDSLVQVHRLGLIHRDISPDNIIITKYNQVKLIDFGAAKQANLDGKSLSIVLKQGFAPEEQYRTHGEQGAWTDVYALGVTVYFAVTGTLPPESIQRMYKDTIVRPSEKGATINPTQENALMKGLAVYSKNRYQDVTQLINGLYSLRIRTVSAPVASAAPVKPAAPVACTKTAALAAATAKSQAAKPAAKPGAKAKAAKTPAKKSPVAKPSAKAKVKAAPATPAPARPANSVNKKTTRAKAEKPAERKVGLMGRMFGKKNK